MQFRDFVPHVRTIHRDFLGMDFPESTFESFDACVTAARDWVESGGIEVINIETVLLPNIYDPNQDGTLDTDLISSKETRTHWYQFLRVWYRAPARPASGTSPEVEATAQVPEAG